MAQGLIYTVAPDGSLQRMLPSAPENEDRMQALVARYPELISDGDGDLLLIQREQAILDGHDASGRWSVDHLFVTRDAVPVLVELKRAVDTRLRREVVGQMLEYAANATAYWQTGRIADSFKATAEKAGRNPDEILFEFIGDRDAASFWEQVDANFRAGRIKLVFVADEISRELARIVEFMNDQMRADVRAVELRWFASEEGHVTLSPRVIGETERAATAKKAASASVSSTSDPETWIIEQIAPAGDRAAQGAAAYVQAARDNAAELQVTNTGASLILCVKSRNGKAIYPLHLWSEKAEISFSLRWLHDKPQFADEHIRRQLFDDLASIVGSLSTQNLRGFPSFSVDKIADSDAAARFGLWVKKLLDIARG